jgi:hypothetical protein
LIETRVCRGRKGRPASVQRSGASCGTKIFIAFHIISGSDFALRGRCSSGSSIVGGEIGPVYHFPQSKSDSEIYLEMPFPRSAFFCRNLPVRLCPPIRPRFRTESLKLHEGCSPRRYLAPLPRRSPCGKSGQDWYRRATRALQVNESLANMGTIYRRPSCQPQYLS